MQCMNAQMLPLNGLLPLNEFSPMCTIATTICNSPYHNLLPLFVMI